MRRLAPLLLLLLLLAACGGDTGGQAGEDPVGAGARGVPAARGALAAPDLRLRAVPRAPDDRRAPRRGGVGRRRPGPGRSSTSRATRAPGRASARASRCSGTTSTCTSRPTWRSRTSRPRWTKRDSVIFHDNDFEVFLDPDADTHDYFELEINAFGTEWDLFLERPYRDGVQADNDWDMAGLRSAVALDGTVNDPSDEDRGWSLEIAIPFAALAEQAGMPCPARARRPVARELLARRVALERRRRRLREGPGPGDRRAAAGGQLGLVRAGSREHALPRDVGGGRVPRRGRRTRAPGPSRSRRPTGRGTACASSTTCSAAGGTRSAASAWRGSRRRRARRSPRRSRRRSGGGTSSPARTPGGPTAATRAPSAGPGASRAPRTPTSRGSGSGTGARSRSARTAASASSTRPPGPAPWRSSTGRSSSPCSW